MVISNAVEPKSEERIWWRCEIVSIQCGNETTKTSSWSICNLWIASVWGHFFSSSSLPRFVSHISNELLSKYWSVSIVAVEDTRIQRLTNQLMSVTVHFIVSFIFRLTKIVARIISMKFSAREKSFVSIFFSVSHLTMTESSMRIDNVSRTKNHLIWDCVWLILFSSVNLSEKLKCEATPFNMSCLSLWKVKMTKNGQQDDNPNKTMKCFCFFHSIQNVKKSSLKHDCRRRRQKNQRHKKIEYNIRKRHSIYCN